MASVPLSVALVEDDPETCARLCEALRADPGLRLLFACGSGAEALAALQSGVPDVLLVDLGLPEMHGLALIRAVHARHPACDIMVVTLFGDDASMIDAFAAGARGYLMKDGSERDLARHVHELRAGGSPLSPLVARRLLQRFQAEPAPAGPAAPAAEAPLPALTPLTPRETEVLQLVARGFRHEEVAASLGVSVSTVRTHVRSVYAKLDVHNQAEAVFEARSNGWLT